MGELNNGLPSGPLSDAVTSCDTVSPLWKSSLSPWSIVYSLAVKRFGGAASTCLSAEAAAGSASATNATTAPVPLPMGCDCTAPFSSRTLRTVPSAGEGLRVSVLRGLVIVVLASLAWSASASAQSSSDPLEPLTGPDGKPYEFVPKAPG